MPYRLDLAKQACIQLCDNDAALSVDVTCPFRVLSDREVTQRLWCHSKSVRVTMMQLAYSYLSNRAVERFLRLCRAHEAAHDHCPQCSSPSVSAASLTSSAPAASSSPKIYKRIKLTLRRKVAGVVEQEQSIVEGPITLPDPAHALLKPMCAAHAKAGLKLLAAELYKLERLVHQTRETTIVRSTNTSGSSEDDDSTSKLLLWPPVSTGFRALVLPARVAYGVSACLLSPL